MAVEIKVPSVGESVTEGTIGRWFKRDGDTVQAEEPLFDLETDKATTEVAAPSGGTLRIGVREGQTVPIGTVVGRIEESPVPSKVQREKPDGTAATAAPRQPAKEPVRRAEPSRTTEAPPEPEPPASPAVRQLAAQRGLNLRQISGSGPAGRITKEDILRHHEQPPPAAPATPPAPTVSPQPKAAEGAPAAQRESRARMTTIRQRVAERLIAAQQTAAILTTFNEADLSAVIALRSLYKESFQKKHGVGLGFMPFFVKAAVEALRAFPVINAWIDGSEIVCHHYYHIGVAVSTERGLMVPVLRDADEMTFADIERRIAELAQRAREGKIAVDDLQGGTFTITNGGVFGSLLSTPILNPPQSAILGMHAIQKRPVAVNDQVVIRPMMYLALSYDHRLIDGREAVLFLGRIKECVENPERLLLQV